ncbi:MAG: hypothetical protein KAX49_14010 [Halanaerobiales bacterium]|nr:hypothetical protein [Halanaerobiales bacterium]
MTPKIIKWDWYYQTGMSLEELWEIIKEDKKMIEEYFLEAIEYPDRKINFHPIVLKRAGRGLMEPINVYIDGEFWKQIVGEKQAKKEAIGYIDMSY